LTRAVALGPEHISPYQLTIETGTAFHRAVQRGRLVPEPPAQAAALYEATDEVLSGLGFATYEISNHAMSAAARSTHNLLYWRSADWIGVGPGAHGRVSIAGTRHAAKAADRPGDYVAAVLASGVGWGEPAEALSLRAVAEEYWLSALRPVDGALAADRRRLRIDDPPTDLLADAARGGLLTVNDEAIRLTRSGRLVADRIAMDVASAVR
jgi:oxygen-independent coproporphyrinogen-3 oxidase